MTATRDTYDERVQTEAAKRRQAVREDYEWLIATGETNPERIALRLGFASVATLDRYLHRADVPLRHYRRAERVAA